MAVATLLAISALIGSDLLEAHQLVTPGGQGPSAQVILADFGPDAVNPEATGYDGQQTYAIARHFPDLDAAAEHTDSAWYRMMRIVHPVLAWPFPSGTPTVFGILLANLVGLALAIRAVGLIGAEHGIPTTFTLLAVTPLAIGVFGSTAEPLAWGLALTGIRLSQRSHHAMAITVFVIAALTRETTIIAAGVVGLAQLVQRRPQGWRIAPAYLMPAAVVGGWYLWLKAAVGGRDPQRTDLLGFLDLSPAGAVVPALVFALGLVAAWTWRDDLVLMLCCAVFTLWMVAYTPNILDDVAILRVNVLPVMLGVLGIGRLVAEASAARATTDAELAHADA